VKISIRLDPIAEMRDAQPGSDQPSPAAVALWAAQAGADAVTAQLRGDRRGIRESDLDLLQKGVGIPFYFDIAPTRDTVKTALLYSPAGVTLVPERREDYAHAGAIDVELTAGVLEATIKDLREHGVPVFVAVDPDLPQIRAAHRIHASGVRLSTRPFALSPGREGIEALRLAAQAARKVRLTVHAGGGLTFANADALAGIEEIELLHVGSAIISRAVFVGLDRAVRDFREALARGPRGGGL
jgi:pyridoxine 5-phosphate synthase